MIEQMMNNAVCWAIVVLALCCYQTLWLRYLRQRKTPLQRDEQPPIHHGDAHEPFHRFSTVLISALPLLGLLGTMMGLLDCFATIANGAVSGESMNRGIADALLSTQLGLLCAIPAWLLQAWVRASSRRIATHAVKNTMINTMTSMAR
ncbi:MAG: MotA/TolQ/ExbB proton channel family protein [Gammaproteobacteria bacterium]